jgi:inosine/xanthosine triphosphatase
MNRIIVASKNPAKINAAVDGFKRMFPQVDWDVRGVNAASGVSDQPLSDEETLQGAVNRARQAKLLEPEADYWVGMEGGIETKDGAMEAFAWMVVLSRQRIGKARTASFQLPPKVAELVQEGYELGHADDMVFGKTNSKQANGAVGLLTGDVVDRSGLYAQAVILALVPHKNEELYPGAAK